MIKIYVWLPHDNNVGHTAMLAGATYISFWPEDGFDKKDLKFKRSKPGDYVLQLEEDIRREGGREPIVVELHNIDEMKVVRHFDQIAENRPRYQLLRYNCSHVIAQCLIAGAERQPSFTPHAGHYSNLLRRLTIGVWTPDQILKFANELKFL